jgi:hypothetical protein
LLPRPAPAADRVPGNDDHIKGDIGGPTNG